jgi:Ca2+-binding RTX toxin-like protein
MFESLESRWHMSISESNGIVTVGGTSGADAVTVFGNKASATVFDGSGASQEFSNIKKIIINGKGGNDTLTCANLNGTAGVVHVKIEGGPGNDVIHGAIGNDTLIGGKGNDDLHGLDGKDTIKGGSGKDTLVGGNGKDELKPGPGKDNVQPAYIVEDDVVIQGLEELMAE